MNGIVALFLACAGAAQFLLPRRWLALPTLLTFAWIPRAQVVEIADVKLTAFRIVVGLALVRILVRREKLPGGIGRIDALWSIWSLLMVGTWLLHTSDDLVFRFGLVWDYFGAYLVMRYAISNYEDIDRVFVTFCLALVPVALLMLIENQIGNNPFGVVGGLDTQWREGKFRAAGPFAHPILAGSVGATCLIIGCSLFRWRRALSMVSIGAGTTMVYASASSGPVLMSAIGILALLTWRFRHRLRAMRWSVLFVVFALQIVMKDPFYFLMAKVDVVGGSTGWHRSQLIKAALDHLDEWWLAGTDYTIHWMPTGIPASDRHTDITNHFLMMGVLGGLPLLLALLAAMVLVLRQIDLALLASNGPVRNLFTAWTIGALIVAHGMNFLATYLFDQSILSFMICFACAGVVGRVRPDVQSEVKGRPIAARVPTWT
jgi:hypothetical protein